MQRPVKYKDLLFRAIACLLAAHVLVMMGEDVSSLEAFTIWSYYPTLAINYVIALIVGRAVKKVTVALDKKHNWYRDIWRRAILQFIFGVMAVSILSFFLVWLYFVTFSRDISASGYFDYEFPFSITLITILNLYYVAYYFYVNPRFGEPVATIGPFLPGDKEAFPAQDVTGNDRKYASIELSAVSDAQKEGESNERREILIIDTPVRSIPVRIRKCVMFFIYSKTVFVRLKGMKGLNECYQLSMNLGDIIEMLDERDFFRINRQCIVSFDVIGSYEHNGEKGLSVTLTPDHGKLENISQEDWDKLIKVSVDKVPDFKAWMNR